LHCCLSFFCYHLLNCIDLVSSGVYCGGWELLAVALSGRFFSGECGWGEREREEEVSEVVGDDRWSRYCEPT
jgi:hypothetical protein